MRALTKLLQIYKWESKGLKTEMLRMRNDNKRIKYNRSINGGGKEKTTMF